ncbi:hypothetical protein RI367_006681 [Sorochytrium milnesiophthora]
MTATTTSLKLYSARICPFAQRCAIALAELGWLKSLQDASLNDQNVQVEFIDLRNKPAWYVKEINPRGTVPALQVTLTSGETKVLLESALITQYIVEEFGATSGLIPSTPLERYQAAFFVDAVQTSLQAAIYVALKAKTAEEQRKAEEQVLVAARGLNALLVSNSAKGPYALGDRFTIADVLTAPFVTRIYMLEEFRDWKLPLTSEFARINQWIDALNQRASVQVSSMPKQMLIDMYRNITEPKQ